MRRALDRLLLRSVNRALSQNSQTKPKKTQLKLHNLEAREQAGNIMNGLFAAATGTAMADPLQAMAAAVGDLAMLADSPQTPSQVRSNPSKPAPTTDHANTSSAPVSHDDSSRKSATDEWTGSEPVNSSNSFVSGNSDSWDLSIDDSKPLKGSDSSTPNGGGSSGGSSGETPSLYPSTGSAGSGASFDPVFSEGNNDTSVSPTSAKAASPSALKASSLGASLSPQSIEQFIATAERDASTLYSTESPVSALRSSGVVVSQTTDSPIYAVGTDAGGDRKSKGLRCSHSGRNVHDQAVR